MPTIASPLDPVALEEEFDRLIAFGRRFPHPGGGAAWLDDDGTPDLTRPIYTWITARMAHIYCLAHIRGVTGADELADSALGGLTGTLKDHQNGGWFSSIHAGTTADEKSCYAHAFVVLAASSAAIADRPGARSLLDEALTVWDQRFFDPDSDMFVDSWNAAFSTRSPYRGLNANMHSVEALLAAADATGEQRLRDRATTIGYWVAALAERHGWRMPEHFGPDWQPMLEHNRDKPDDPFQPFGATVGHGLEWSRLLLHLHASAADPAPTRLRDAAVALFDRAVADGWEVDAAPGFVYTTDWDGVPVVRDRMHWVVAEAISAGAALHQVTDDQRYGDLCRLWWDYATRYLMDHQRGSWHHQLDATNSPIATVWPGKPDIYHAAQTTLIPRLPLAPTLALALHQEPTAGT